MKKILFICGLVLIFAGYTSAQNTTITIGTIEASAGDEISIPVDVSGFLNVGAISFKINYDPAVLDYEGIENFPQSGHLFTPPTSTSGVISFSWLSTETQINIPNGKLFDIKFKKLTSGSSNLSFQLPQSKIYNSAVDEIPATYVNGAINAPQTETLQINLGTVTATGSTVAIPISVTNFDNISAITLNIQFDATVAEFTGITGGPAGMQAGAVGNTITLSWSSAIPINLGNATLATLQFNYLSGSSNLSFNQATSQIVDGNLNILTGIVYGSGAINADPSTEVGLEIGTVQGTGTEVTVPINAINFDNISAITLNILFDPAVAAFSGIENGPANMQANAVGNTITLSWSSAAAINLGDATLVDLKFDYVGGNTSLNFNTATCQIVDGNLVVIEHVNYSNGAILADPETQISIKIDSVEVSGAEASVPITVTNFDNIAAITLNIQFDPAVATFTGIEGGPANMQANAVGNMITLSWSSATAINLGDATLATLKFDYSGGKSDLAFNTATCQIVDGNLSILHGIIYEDGLIQNDEASQITMALATVLATGSEVSVPLTVTNFNNISAITLSIQFDPVVVSFDGIEGGPANMQSGVVGNTITLSWSNATAINLGNDTLVTLNFTHNQGQTNLTFNQSGSQIVDGNLNVINGINYVNGAITATGFPILTIPNVAATSGEILVPIEVQNFNNIGSLTLNIQYNEVNLVYQGIQDAPAGIQVGVNDGIISLSWASVTALPVTEGTLLNLRFTYGGPSSMIFLVPQCQLTTTEAEIITYVQYNNGSVSTDVPPSFTSVLMDTTIAETDTLVFDYEANDPNGTEITFSLVDGPEGSEINTETGVFTWITDYDSEGEYVVRVAVSDGVTDADTTEATVTVVKTNRAPVITNLPESGEIPYQGSYSYQLEAQDADGDAYTFGLISSTVAGVTVSAQGLISFTPEGLLERNDSLVVMVTDAVDSTRGTIALHITDVPNISNLPKEYGLQQNFPNPFNPTTKIKYDLPQEAKVVLSVYNLLGQRVAVLVNESQHAGYHTVEFDASKFTSGIYLYKIEANEFSQIRKMIILK